MSDVLSNIKETITDFIEELDTSFFVVELDVNQTSRKINLTLDGDQGIQIQFCHKTAKFIRRLLEEQDMDYDIQVSSPGLENKFVLWRQFKKNLNRKMKLKLKAKEGQLKVRLTEVDEEKQILTFNKKVKKETIVHSISFEEIEYGKIIIEF